jgi:hypothetical protein
LQQTPLTQKPEVHSDELAQVAPCAFFVPQLVLSAQTPDGHAELVAKQACELLQALVVRVEPLHEEGPQEVPTEG